MLKKDNKFFKLNKKKKNKKLKLNDTLNLAIATTKIAIGTQILKSI